MDACGARISQDESRHPRAGIDLNQPVAGMACASWPSMASPASFMHACMGEYRQHDVTQRVPMRRRPQ